MQGGQVVWGAVEWNSWGRKNRQKLGEHRGWRTQGWAAVEDPEGRLAAAGVTSMGFSFPPWLWGPGQSRCHLVAMPAGGSQGCTDSWAHRWKGDQMVMMFTIIREDTSELSFINHVTTEERMAQVPVTVSGATQMEC